MYFRQRYWFDAKKIKGDWLQSDIKCIFKNPLCPGKEDLTTKDTKAGTKDTKEERTDNF
jgi:hypothetical protein